METKNRDKVEKVDVFSTTETQCVWMKTGIVNFKICDNAFDCTTCAFDKAMSRKVEQKPTVLVSWREVQRSKPYSQRECRHMLAGRVRFYLCNHNYECQDCQYDQILYEEDLSAASASAPLRKVSGFEVADGYYYHRGHSWARIENGGFVRLGIDDFALRLLGCPTGITLPKIGTRIKQSKTGWSIRRGTNEAALLSPMSGVVVATNYKAVT